ncbi:hypothetical protein RJ639_030147 [Escallonia herrerae]|uniref:RNase H type-1 domain-containing protein n=1 Tax=Escallonia herrerae TaxID=1293975 RepID=A0AA88X144_9ASTE|nr:hypothetical protein RJ639_030147 [Escallonia herrerae]
MGPTAAEATTAFLAIDMAIQSKCTNVIFERDAALIVNWLNDHEVQPEWLCLIIINEAREKLRLFTCWDFVRVHRLVNSPAYDLAEGAEENNCFGPSSLEVVADQPIHREWRGFEATSSAQF